MKEQAHIALAEYRKQPTDANLKSAVLSVSNYYISEGKARPQPKNWAKLTTPVNDSCSSCTWTSQAKRTAVAACKSYINSIESTQSTTVKKGSFRFKKTIRK